MKATRTALFFRLQAALRAEGLDLRVARGAGQYYVVCGESVVNKDVNLETLAREMELFESWETGGLTSRPEARRAPSLRSQPPLLKWRRPRHSRSRSQ